MNRRVVKTGIACAAMMALLISFLTYRMLSPGIMNNAQLSENGLYVYDVPQQFTDFNLIDQYERPFTQRRLQDKWTLLFFGYTFCPDICPLTLATMSQFSRLLEDTNYAEDTQVVMVSVDPMRDTPEKLRDYMGYFNPDYIGVTGAYAGLFALALQLNVPFSHESGLGGQGGGEAEGESYLVSHSGVIILINPNGQSHGFFKTPHEPDRMLVNYTALRKAW